MDKDLSDDDLHNSSSSRDPDNDQSLVGKLKNHVTGIISNTPLSKWFRKNPQVSRRRGDDSDQEEEFQDLQPPTKRTKLPPSKETLSLNVSEVLSPISAANNFNKISYKHFPEPIAGPSGFCGRKLLNSTSVYVQCDKHSAKVSELGANRNKDSDSEESTSGYSSGRVGSKEMVSQESSKQTSPLESSPRKARSLFQGSSSGRSLFSDRSLSPNVNSTLSSRNPSFNPSTFGSPNFVDRTLSTKRILNSPFYNGRTIYGGASAYGRSSGRAPQDLRKALRQSVQIKPVNKGHEKGDLQLGKTARRILDTLEQYSSPVSDAKKIPVSCRLRSDGLLTKYTGANPYRVRDRGASTKELQVPSVTDLLKMKLDQQKTRLQDSTEAVRQIATMSKSVLNEENYTIPVQSEKDRHTGKVKTKITSVRQRAHVNEAPPELRLNPVSLPIKDLPKFDLVLPPKPSTIPVVDKSPVALKTVIVQPRATDFKFSSPIVLAHSLKPIKALNNFKFSEPLIKKRRSIHPELDTAVELERKRKNNGENLSLLSGMKKENDKELMEKFKPAEGTWECAVCLIRNQVDKAKCAACETARASITKAKEPTKILPTPSLFGDKFKAPTNTWECPTCLIRNNEEALKCMACESQKPGAASNKAPLLGGSSSSLGGTNFGAKFAPPASSWECPTCMIRNKDEVSKCVACETSKPGAVKSAPSLSFGGDFKKKENEWECEVCMVRNKSCTTKCQCCESIKPGSAQSAASSIKNTPIKSSFNFGIDKSTASSFTFGVPPDAQASITTPKTNAALIFGVTAPKKVEVADTDKTTPSFSFGVPNKSEKAEPVKATPSLSFGVVSKSAEAEGSKAPPSYGFGVVDKSKEVKPKNTTPVLSFGTGKEEEERNKKRGLDDKSAVQVKKVNPLLKADDKLPKKAAVAPVGFSFGLAVASTQSTASTTTTTVTSASTSDESPSKRSKPTANTTEPTKTPMFNFKSSSANGDINKTSPFARPITTSTTNKTPSPPSGGFAFNFGAAKVAVTSSVTAPSAGGFGSAVAQMDSNKSAPMFKFSSPSTEVPKQTNGFSFGATPAPAPSFGAKAKSASSAGIKPFAFGSPTPASTNPAPSKAPVFQFGGSPAHSENKSRSNATPFSFNPETKPQPPSSSTFSFGSTPAKAPAFSFGQSAGPTPNFNFTTSSKPESSFGAGPTQAPPPNGLFNFGAGAAGAQKAGFSFGAAAGGSEGGAAPAGFSFGAAATAPTAAGFNFSSPAPSFNANAKPSFNFSEGTGVTTFAAPPSTDGSLPQRKIKKAIRRTQVR